MGTHHPSIMRLVCGRSPLVLVQQILHRYRLSRSQNITYANTHLLRTPVSRCNASRPARNTETSRRSQSSIHQNKYLRRVFSLSVLSSSPARMKSSFSSWLCSELGLFLPYFLSLRRFSRRPESQKDTLVMIYTPWRAMMRMKPVWYRGASDAMKACGTTILTTQSDSFSLDQEIHSQIRRTTVVAVCFLVAPVIFCPIIVNMAGSASQKRQHRARKRTHIRKHSSVKVSTSSSAVPGVH